MVLISVSLTLHDFLLFRELFPICSSADIEGETDEHLSVTPQNKYYKHFVLTRIENGTGTPPVGPGFGVNASVAPSNFHFA